MTEPTTVVDACHFLEAPRWRDDRVWFSDFYAYQVYSVREDGSDLRVETEVPGQPAGLSQPASAGCPTAGCSSCR
jgi:sugar lactone lactonase YvrE